mmetsp:Transcript_16248/g.33404  ORF Transcript_16248/g.33404 Transcript_16248/m.33404 type:complete len:471 (-) Transcript_16248:37-1449(-)
MRDNHAEVALEQSGGRDSGGRKGRTEYIPIEWHERFNSLSRMNSSSIPSAGLNDISLNTIPHMRSFANDAMLDTLYFMSEQHHEIIINLVVHELNLVVEKFRKFKRRQFKGKVSIVAHSLGSVITWDILANQTVSEPSVDGVYRDDAKVPVSITTPKPDKKENTEKIGILQSLLTPLSSSKKKGKGKGKGKGKENKDGGGDGGDRSTEQGIPQTQVRDYPQLNFRVSNTFMLGSPIAVFLLIRNQEQPLESDYSLPGCSRMFNVFHPFDPAAYRLEPLISRRNANVEPVVIPTWKGAYRVKYQAKMMMKKIGGWVNRLKSKIFTKVEEGISKVGLLDSSMEVPGEGGDEEGEIVAAGEGLFGDSLGGGSFDEDGFEDGVSRGEGDGLKDDDDNGDGDDDDSSVTSSVASSESESGAEPGRLCGGERIDYVLQEKEIEHTNEYLFALGAHSMYWAEKDLSLFIYRQLLKGD